MLMGTSLGLSIRCTLPSGGPAPDTTPPELVSITVGIGGDEIIFAFSEDLVEDSVPDDGDFDLDGTTATLDAGTVSGNTVVFPLIGFVLASETVTADYTPGATPIFDLTGSNAAAGFTAEPVTNNSTYELVPPELIASGIFETTSGTTNTPDMSGVAFLPGDLVLIFGGYRATADPATGAVPAGQGWTILNEVTASNTAAFVAYKIWGAGDTDDTTPTITWSSAGLDHATAWMVWRNIDPDSPIFATVRVDPSAAATITAGNVGSAPPAHSTTVWAFYTTDDNTLNAHSRGTPILSENIGTVACMALVYEQSVNSNVEECSMNESTNGNDSGRIFTVVIRGAAQVASPSYELTLLSSTGYGSVPTNCVGWPQCSIITDPTARSGFIWRYGAWYDRSPTVESRLYLFKQRRPVGDPDGWEASTITASTGALNETSSAGDTHLAPALGVDEDGHLIMFWNAHWEEFQYAYWRGTGPGDIAVTLATTDGGITGNALPAGLPVDLSYPKLFTMADGSLCMTARIGAGGAGTQGLWEFDAGTNTWAEVSDEMIAPPGDSPYMHHVHVNPTTGVVHFAFTVAEGQNTTTYRDVCYFQATRPGGFGTAWTFKDVGGTTRSLPITDAAHFVALATGLNRGVRVHQGLSATAADVPLITAQYAKDGAVDRTDGSNRYLITRSAGAWVRQTIHEIHPEWNLIDGNGSSNDPDGVNNEYGQVGSSNVLYDAATGAVHIVYRSNYQLGSSGIPCLMVTSSFAAPYSSWTTPTILADTPVGDGNPVHDTTAWDYLGQATYMLTLIDWASQYAGGAASPVYIADCILPEAP